MDLARASDQLDALIERRTTAKSNANALEEMWNAGAARRHERERRANRAAWYSHYGALADAHARISEHFEAKAQALLEGENETERSNT